MTKGDLISRQAVEDVIYDYSRSHAVDYAQIRERIDKIPSVENKGELIECARALKKHCFNTKDCKECFMQDECEYELSAPCDWDLPESEEEGE